MLGIFRLLGVGIYRPNEGPTAPVVSSYYRRPGGVDRYRRPGGVDLYLRP